MISPPIEQAYELALRHHVAGRAGEAQSLCRQILSDNPRHAGALHLLGLFQRDAGDPHGASELFRRAISIEPTGITHYGELGKTYSAMGRPDLEADVYQHITVLCPDLPEGHCNLAMALHECGKLHQALSCYQRALTLRSEYEQASIGLAGALMTLGHFQQGWPALEIIARRAARNRFPQPLWDGQVMPNGCILLHEEEGFGDTIQYVRFVSRVCQCCREVYLQCHPQLKEALEGQFPALRIFAHGEPLPPFQAHCPLMSLPRIFGLTAQTIPATVPYIKACPARLARWNERFNDGAALKVGLVWAGRPQPPRRSLEPALLEALCGVPSVQFYSLQKGDADLFAQLPRSLCAKDLSSELTDFAETASAIANLDLLITVDTAAAHLGGALGQRTWVLLNSAPDWRWMIGRNDSPWYPTMRLFRQPRPRDWQSVLRAVRRELETLAKSPHRDMAVSTHAR
jgi:tetratricopeptide (TPR) repeat protein